MNFQKIITLAIYAALAIAAFVFPGTTIATVAKWAPGVLLVAHLLEFAVVIKLLKQAEGSMAHHFFQTLLFGYVHWFPLKQAMESPAEA